MLKYCMLELHSQLLGKVIIVNHEETICSLDANGGTHIVHAVCLHHFSSSVNVYVDVKKMFLKMHHSSLILDVLN